MRYSWENIDVQQIDYDPNQICELYDKVKKTRSLYLAPNVLQPNCIYTFAVNVTFGTKSNIVNFCAIYFSNRFMFCRKKNSVSIEFKFFNQSSTLVEKLIVFFLLLRQLLV